MLFVSVLAGLSPSCSGLKFGVVLMLFKVPFLLHIEIEYSGLLCTSLDISQVLSLSSGIFCETFATTVISMLLIA